MNKNGEEWQSNSQIGYLFEKIEITIHIPRNHFFIVNGSSCTLRFQIIIIISIIIIMIMIMIIVIMIITITIIITNNNNNKYYYGLSKNKLEIDRMTKIKRIDRIIDKVMKLRQNVSNHFKSCEVEVFWIKSNKMILIFRKFVYHCL